MRTGQRAFAEDGGPGKHLPFAEQQLRHAASASPSRTTSTAIVAARLPWVPRGVPVAPLWCQRRQVAISMLRLLGLTIVLCATASLVVTLYRYRKFVSAWLRDAGTVWVFSPFALF